MSDCLNAITLAVWVYVLIPFWMVWGYYWIKDKRAQRRERQRIAGDECGFGGVSPAPARWPCHGDYRVRRHPRTAVPTTETLPADLLRPQP